MNVLWRSIKQAAAARQSIVTAAWSPLRNPLFRMIWIAAVASNIGIWMQDIAAAWLMTSLTSEPIMVALVQTATSLPVVLLALPAGALADIVDRRRLLLLTVAWVLEASLRIPAIQNLNGTQLKFHPAFTAGFRWLIF